jgi:hypothetical protein
LFEHIETQKIHDQVSDICDTRILIKELAGERKRDKHAAAVREEK